MRAHSGARRRLVATLLFGAACIAKAQDLEPRAYSPSPAGANFIVLGLAHSSGDVLLDPALPFENVDASATAAVAGYARSFGLLGRSASAALAVPYVDSDVSGDVREERRSVRRTGFGDPRLRLAVNLVGGEALTPREFATRQVRTSLGASVVLVAPLGEYDSTKLVNLGANRWAVKAELGLSHPVGRWHFEVYAGAWLFGDNERFLGSAQREQDPIVTLQTHVSYTFRPQLWLAVDATYYRGGQTTIDGRGNPDTQSNSRIGVTLSLPVAARHSLKFTASEGFTTRVGGDFSNFGVAWQYLWFD